MILDSFSLYYVCVCLPVKLIYAYRNDTVNTLHTYSTDI